MSNNDEVKGVMINLYEKLSQVNLTREYLENELNKSNMTGISNPFYKIQHLQQKCGFCNKNVKGTTGIYIERLDGKKEMNCYNCMKRYVRNDFNELSNEKVDYLGWGLVGLFEQHTSDESSYYSTSSEGEMDFNKKCLYSRHKILRRLRRKKPQAFQHNYIDMSASEPIKSEIDDPVLRRSIKRGKGIDDRDQGYTKNLKLSKPSSKEYDYYAWRNFDFGNEIGLKEKYSSTKFDLLTGLIHYYQKFLKRHPEERYPNVSELIIKTGQNICKDEEEVVARYYEVLYKKGGSKKIDESVSANNTLKTSESKSIQNNQVQEEKNKPLRLQAAILPEDLLYAKKTGILDLNRKGLTNIPVDVWKICNKTSETKFELVKRLSNSPYHKVVPKSKPLIYLNLSYNKLTEIQPRGNCFETLLHLYLNDNNIKQLPDAFGSFRCLQILDLENNMLKILPKRFGDIASLKDLNLRRNCIVELPNSFGNLKKLKTVDLSWNRLIKLPDTIEDLESLNNLNISFNKVTDLPMDFCNLFNLVILDISYNKITELPTLGDMPKLLMVNAMGNLIKEFPNFSKSRSLCEVRLDGNRIKRIVTKNLLDCPVVQLTLSHNKIEKIPDDLYEVETIVLLDLTYNRLSHLPFSLARLKYLTCLRVEENHIENLPKDVLNGGSKKIIGELLCNLLSYDGDNKTISKAKDELVVLYMKGETDVTLTNKNESLDPTEVARTHTLVKKRLELTTLKNEWLEIAEKYKVKKVDISKNKFRYLPAGLKSLSASLNELNVRENNLKTIPDFIGRMPHLTILDLSYNHLDSLPLTMATCHLTKFICKRNLFAAMPKVVYMIQTIEYLDFSENMLKELDIDGLRNLRKLHYLDISKNEIKKLPTEFGYLSNIKELDLSDNHFKKPGPHVIRAGTKVLMEYLKRHPHKT